MILTRNERRELQRQSTVRNGRADSARHARLILLLADNLTWAEIREKLDCSDSYINAMEQAICCRPIGVVCLPATPVASATR